MTRRIEQLSSESK